MWNKETEEMLRQLWANGCSASYIAEKLGPPATKNSVIGKARRLKLDRHPTVITRKPTTKRRFVLKKKHNVVSINPLPLAELKDGCLYHLEQNLFCANDRRFNSSYCPEHHKICYVKNTYQR